MQQDVHNDLQQHTTTCNNNKNMQQQQQQIVNHMIKNQDYTVHNNYQTFDSIALHYTTCITFLSIIDPFLMNQLALTKTVT